MRSFFDNDLRKITDGFKMPSRQEVMERLRALLESGKLTPIVSKTFPLAEVPAAMRCMIEGRTLGRIVIQP